MTVILVRIPEMLGFIGDPEPPVGGGGCDDGGDPFMGGDPDKDSVTYSNTLSELITKLSLNKLKVTQSLALSQT